MPRPASSRRRRASAPAGCRLPSSVSRPRSGRRLRCRDRRASERARRRGDRLPAVLGARRRELLPSLRYDLVSTIAYFGVPALSSGTLQKTGTYWNGWTSTHMTNVINAAHAEGVKVVLAVTMMAWDGDYAPMTALLNEAAAAHPACGGHRRGRHRAQRGRREPRLRADAQLPPVGLHRIRARREGRARTAASSRWPPPAARRPGTRATTSPALVGCRAPRTRSW